MNHCCRSMLLLAVLMLMLGVCVSTDASADDPPSTDDSLINLEGWNTLVIRAQGGRHQILLNGHEVADVRDDTSDHGRVGFQVHAGDQFEKMRVLIQQVGIREL